MILFLDLETFSSVPLSNGIHAYAEHAEILLTAWAVDDGAVEVEDGWPTTLMQALLEQAERIVIHNSHFDRTVLRHAEGVALPVHKLWDTVAQARSAGLPGGLARLCEILKIEGDDRKDREGKALIQLFCKPRPQSSKLVRATSTTHPAEWQRFRAYAGRDITAMREVYRRLPKWNYEHPTERAVWELDQAINDRGFLVDTDLARAAVAAVAQEKKRLAARCDHLTAGEVQAATQRDALLKHLLSIYGVYLPDMQKGTLERRLGDETLPDVVRELIAIRLEASGTATTKYQRLLDAVSPDGRLRGTLEWCGAASTGRWAGRLFQPQNLPRPWLPQEEIDTGIEAIKSGCAELVLDKVIDYATNAVRGCIVAPPGKQLAVADLSNIEGRVLAWLAGEDWKLEAFRAYDRGDGHDLYHITAGSVLGKPPGEVTKAERQRAGKVPELACGYQGAVGAFASMAKLLGLQLPEDEVLAIVKAWRRKNSQIVSFWYELGDAALAAVRTPGVTLTCRRLRLRRDGAWLRIVLPSGRALCYAMPRITPGQTCDWCGGTGKDPYPADLEQPERCPECFGRGRIPEVLSYKGLDPYTRRWTDIKTYGGKLVAYVTQAVARDVMVDGMLRIDHSNLPFDLVLTVHDEILAEVPLDFDKADQVLAHTMSIPPAWAPDLPLAAGGFTALRYRKDG